MYTGETILLNEPTINLSAAQPMWYRTLDAKERTFVDEILSALDMRYPHLNDEQRAIGFWHAIRILGE